MEFSFNEFIKTESFFGIKIGDHLDKINSKFELILSNYLDSEGNPEMCDLIYSKIRVRCGLRNKKIIYIMVSFDRYNKKIDFMLNKTNLRKSSLSNILEFLNKEVIPWKYKEILDKVIVISIGDNYNFELVYSMEIGEEGAYCFQLVTVN